MNVTVPRLDLVDSPYHDPASNFPDILEHEGRELRSLESLHVISKIADTFDVRSNKEQAAVRLKLNARAVRRVKKQLLSEGYKPSLAMCNPVQSENGTCYGKLSTKKGAPSFMPKDQA